MGQSDKKLRHMETFIDALYDSGGRTYMNELLKNLVPSEIQERILNEFNAYIDRVNAAIKSK